MNKLSQTFIECGVYQLPILLIILWRFLNFLYTNRSEGVSIDTLFTYWFLFSLIIMVPAFLLLLLTTVWRPLVAISIYVFTIGLFVFPVIEVNLTAYMRYRYVALLTTLSLVILIWIIYRFLPLENIVKTFLITLSLLLLIPISQLSVDYVLRSLADEALDVQAARAEIKRRPNIYFIVLDAYARGDQLKMVLGFDNSQFLDFLKGNGFYIASDSYGSYPSTSYSLGTTFRMEHIENLDPNIGNKKLKSAVVRSFLNIDYRVVFMPSHRGAWLCPARVLCINNEVASGWVIGELERNLLKMTPFYNWLSVLAPEFLHRHQIVVTNEVSDLRRALAERPFTVPTFLFARIMMPHPPYLRDAECRPVSLDTAGNIRVFLAIGKTAYVDFLRCGNDQMIELIDDIIERDSVAIIIIQSDHGSGFVARELNEDEPLAFRDGDPRLMDALEERYAILNASRAPEPCAKWLYESISPVNTFRFVFACLSNTEPVFLPDVAYRVDHRTETVELIREDGEWLIGR